MQKQPTLKMLLVDDDMISQKIHCMLLEGLGYQVDIAADGYQAVIQSNNDYDFILMDVGLPILTGIEATAEIRKQEQTLAKSRLPIFILTGYTHEETKNSALAVGADEVLLKPLQINQLVTVLERYFEIKTNGNGQ